MCPCPALPCPPYYCTRYSSYVRTLWSTSIGFISHNIIPKISMQRQCVCPSHQRDTTSHRMPWLYRLYTSSSENVSKTVARHSGYNQTSAPATNTSFYPQPGTRSSSTIIPHHQSGTPNPPSPWPTPSPRHITNLTPNDHTRIAIDKVLVATTAHDSTRIHLYHLQVSLKLSHLRRLRTTMRPCNIHHLLFRVLYYHLLISARSPFIPRYRYLSLTMDNTIHIMTPISHTSRQHDYTTSTYFSTNLRDPHIYNIPMTVAPTTTILSLCSDLPPPPVYLVVSSPLSDLDDIAWCVPRIKRLTWARRSHFL